MKIFAKELLSILCECSEKAAKIARRCRLDKDVFQLLVEEKKGEEKNERFLHDFKTLADVLIQEVVRYGVRQRYPELGSCVYGEETNEFTNAKGDVVVLDVDENREKTASALLKILGDSNVSTVNLLLNDIYDNDQVDVDVSSVPDGLTLENIGIWIDPIDCTNEYVKGEESVPSPVPGIFQSGLACVTVLIGVFSQSTHEPFLGVVNQPFFGSQEEGYCSKLWWGLSVSNIKCNNLPQFHRCLPATAVISKSERQATRIPLSESFRLVEAAGAGYKILCNALGLADVFVLSTPTTFKYDTCAPHALLLSQGGNLVELDGILDEKVNSGSVDTQGYQVTYFPKGAQSHKNEHGIVAFVQESSLLDVIDLLV